MKLTSKQQNVINLIASGMNNRQISEALGISVVAVENHVFRLRICTGVQKRTDLAQFADTQSVGTFPRLSEKEINIIILLSRGLQTNEIAEQLKIKPVSVRTYISNMLQKTDRNSREELVSWAIDKCIVEAAEDLTSGGKRQRRTRKTKTQQQARIEREKRLYGEVAARLGFYHVGGER